LIQFRQLLVHARVPTGIDSHPPFGRPEYFLSVWFVREPRPSARIVPLVLYTPVNWLVSSAAVQEQWQARFTIHRSPWTNVAISGEDSLLQRGFESLGDAEKADGCRVQIDGSPFTHN
jgi:hypothetical protein